MTGIFDILLTTTMSTKRTIKPIGSLIFCPVCGTLLDLPRDDQDEIECHQCGRKEPASCGSIVDVANDQAMKI